MKRFAGVAGKFMGAVGGGVVGEYPLSGAFAECKAFGFGQIAEEVKGLFGGARNEYFPADGEERVQPVPIVAEDGNAAGSSFETDARLANTRRVSCRRG